MLSAMSTQPRVAAYSSESHASARARLSIFNAWQQPYICPCTSVAVIQLCSSIMHMHAHTDVCTDMHDQEHTLMCLGLSGHKQTAYTLP